MVLLDLGDDQVSGVVALAQGDVAIGALGNAPANKNKLIHFSGTTPEKTSPREGERPLAVSWPGCRPHGCPKQQ